MQFFLSKLFNNNHAGENKDCILFYNNNKNNVLIDFGKKLIEKRKRGKIDHKLDIFLAIKIEQ